MLGIDEVLESGDEFVGVVRGEDMHELFED